jgi:hypothetical protein
MSGPHRNPDRVNTIGIVVVGICGAVLVYVSIVALQAFYMNDTSEVQTMADYGGQDTMARTVRADQIDSINQSKPNAVAAGAQQTYHVPITEAMKLVVRDNKTSPGKLIPLAGDSNKRTIDPVFGRPKMAGGAPPAGTETGSAAPAPDINTGSADAGSGSAATGSGSAAPSEGAGSAANPVPTGGLGQGGGPPPGTQAGGSGSAATNPATPTSGQGSGAKGNAP